MIIKPNSIFSAIVLVSFLLLFACDSPPPVKKQSSSNVISKKIFQPQTTPSASSKNKIDKKTQITPQKSKENQILNDPKLSALNKSATQEEHYNSKGKVDPFEPLIQEKPKATTPIADRRPKRILTPLEKVELSQIRLVAVIIMKDRELAMVEDATGKGYEVGLGTYIGKNQGRVFKIKENSVLVKELTKDYKGRIKESIQEIKLHKNDSED